MTYAVCRRQDWLDGDGWDDWDLIRVFRSHRLATWYLRLARLRARAAAALLPEDVRVLHDYKMIPWIPWWDQPGD